MVRLLNKESLKNGITAKFDRKNRFQIKRVHNTTGLFEYLLSNLSTQETISIAHHLYDVFRNKIVTIFSQLNEATVTNKDIDTKILFKENAHYRIQYSTHTSNQIIVSNLKTTQHFHVDREALLTLVNLLYHPKVGHPNGTFDQIVEYHRLFQFTFNEGSESISSGLTLRKHVLTHVEDYVPRPKNASKSKSIVGNFDPSDLDLKGLKPGTKKSTATPSNQFKSKLGARSHDQNYTVDYDSLFSSATKKGSSDVSPTLPRTLLSAEDNHFQVPLIANDVKNHDARVLKCELSREEASAFRDHFLKDRTSIPLLGFEIFSAVFKHGGKLKAFKFPLYYMRVDIEESGRNAHIYPPKSGDIYLNHLALTELIERFAVENKDERLIKFFSNIQSQKLEVDRNLIATRIHRRLPVANELFKQMREILIGKQGEDGKGGILENLSILGIECDIDAVVLYKTPATPSPVIRALEKDLTQMQSIAKEKPDRFYKSVLGQFLNPERVHLDKNKDRDMTFTNRLLAPGAPPKATRSLVDNLNRHNLVLLEGPPGTGKTFTILNLLLHCINDGKRLLIVSDQKAAIHALTEKLQEYINGRDLDSPAAKKKMNLLKSGVKVIDEAPLTTDTLATWTNKVIKLLGLENTRVSDEAIDIPSIEQGIASIDSSQGELKANILEILESYWGKKGPVQTSHKHFHPTTVEDIRDFIAFTKFLGSGSHNKVGKDEGYHEQRKLAEQFIRDRRYIAASEFSNIYMDFNAKVSDIGSEVDRCLNHIGTLKKLIEKKPRNEREFQNCLLDCGETQSMTLLNQNWRQMIKGEQSWLQKIGGKLKHPCLQFWNDLLRLWDNRKFWLESLASYSDRSSLLAQFQEIHDAIDPDETFKTQCAALEIAEFALKESDGNPTIQEILNTMSRLQEERDSLCRSLLKARLAETAEAVLESNQNGPNQITLLSNCLNALKDCESIDTSAGAALIKELQERLADSFPIWICRKQVVSFLFPTKEEIFDLVIVDEAGQCRVDDALPLLFRAKKVMVVGDDKQTVMDKNSTVDDYLFKNFELDEHLRSLQAWGVKGGGSHLFGMVKSIKQGTVLLDEHYRCPPSIIAYSNEYVYNSELKIMQWQAPGTRPSVVVDYSEKGANSAAKPTKGKYKGIETNMIDRFFEYVAKTVKDIEKETGKQINMETDVAICYFLLKNEPYIKDKKVDFLQKLNRGQDVLDGAGAALQGKERDYIFYLWDINRYNFTFFKQGDDPEKRKGELNVLMSRPKKRAYHFLHQGFEGLKHEQSSITDYLWKTYLKQGERDSKKIWTPRTHKPDPRSIVWQRGSGQGIQGILHQIWDTRNTNLENTYQPNYSVVLGDPQQRIDLILAPRDMNKSAIAIVDLACFMDRKDPETAIIDYFFQMQRAKPGLIPVFAFLHEIADERYLAYQEIERKLKALDESSAA